MTSEERLIFANMLPKMTDIEKTKDLFVLNWVLAKKYAIDLLPHMLYRYRTVNVFSIEEFLFCYIYGACAKKLNDPWESRPLVDIASLLTLYRKLYTDDERDDESIKNSLMETFENMKRWYGENIHISSLCEEFDNELMWAHYANSHKGFVVGYDFRSDFQSEKLEDWLWPVVYSDEPLIGASIAGTEICQSSYAKDFHTKEHLVYPDLWLKLSSIWKKTCWSYEKEWRIISSYSRETTIPEHLWIWIKPREIYYGMDMDPNERLQLHRYALMLHVKEYQMEYKYDGGVNKLVAVPFKEDYLFELQSREFINNFLETFKG